MWLQIITMLKYSKILYIPYLLVVFISIFERLYINNNLVNYSVLAFEALLAFYIGYNVILLQSRETLIQCGKLAAMLGVIKFLIGLPFMFLFHWNSGQDFKLGIAGYFLVSAISISFYAFLGLFGGKIRQLLISES